MNTKLNYTFFIFLFHSIQFNCFSQTLTIREIFDAQVGDSYTYEIKKYLYVSDYIFRKVIAKQSPGNDSLIITYFEAAQIYNGSEYTRQTRTFSQHFNQLDSPYFKLFNQKDTIVLYYDTGFKIPYAGFEHNDSSYLDSCGNLINRRHDNSWAALSGRNETTTIVIKGVGVFYSWIDSERIPFKSIEELPINYVVNASLCGRKTYMPLSLNEFHKTNIQIYPNPCTDFLYLSTDIACTYDIFDIHGLSIMSGISENGHIDVKTLSAGVYYLRIQNNHEINYISFIKN